MSPLMLRASMPRLDTKCEPTLLLADPDGKNTCVSEGLRRMLPTCSHRLMSLNDIISSPVVTFYRVVLAFLVASSGREMG